MADLLEQSFEEVVKLIRCARQEAWQSANTTLVELYWQVGEYIARKVESAAWGDGVINQLADYIARRHTDLKGFNRRNLFRMKQFYGTYRNDQKVSALLTQLPLNEAGLAEDTPTAPKRSGRTLRGDGS